MTAAHPLPHPDDVESFPLTDEYLATLPTEVQEEIRQAEAEAEAGIFIPRGLMERTLEKMRARDGG